MNVNSFKTSSVVDTIEGIKKMGEPKPFTLPRLLDSRSTSFSSTTHKKHVPSSLSNPFPFCSNSNSSQILNKPNTASKKFIASPLPDPFSFCSNKSFSSQNAYVPVSKKLSHSSLVSNNNSLTRTHTSPLITNSRIPSSSSPPTKDTKRIQIPRKPASGREITHNSLRPQVAAADRLFSWHTPHSINHDNELIQRLPEPLVDTAKLAIRGAFAPSTRSTYGAGILRFNQFCDRWSIPESDRMPASYALLCAFIGECKATVSGKTIKSWLSGLRAFHIANRAEWQGDDTWVKMARISASRQGTHHKRPLRSPVSIEHLLTLLRALTSNDPFHAAIWAVATTTFFGCRRLGETVITSVSSFDDKHHVLRSVEYNTF